MEQTFWQWVQEGTQQLWKDLTKYSGYHEQEALTCHTVQGCLKRAEGQKVYLASEETQLQTLSGEVKINRPPEFAEFLVLTLHQHEDTEHFRVRGLDANNLIKRI